MRQRAIARLLVLVLLSSVTGLPGCTAMRTVVPARAPRPFGAVQAGDDVSVVLRNGTHARFMISSVDGDRLTSRAGAIYELADIVTLKRRAPSPTRTVILLGTVGAVVFALAHYARTHGGPYIGLR